VAFWDRFRRGGGEITEASRALTPDQVPERAGYAYGIPMGGLTEYSASTGAATGTDRRAQLAQLYESYLACPWAWACVNAIARTITAGGLVMDWDSDTGEGSQEAPEKTEPVLAVERLINFTNDRQNIRQLLRNVVVDLLVFGDAFIEVTWWGDTPVALYNLDNPTTTPLADEHGKVTGYKQVTEYGAIADFEPRDVIHISLDAPRSGVFGVSPTQAALLPITAWLFAAACGKEMARKGLPTNVHVDFPNDMQQAEQNRWLAQYAARNIGPRNIGTPIATKGGGKVNEIAAGKIGDILAFLDQKRDEIVASFGVPPAKAGIIESGNLGGGTGEAQDATYRIDVCGPIAELILEAINFAIVQNGFGVEGWHAKFREIDYRTSKVRDDIRDERIRNGTITINRARAEIGEPPVEGGDDAVIIDRQNLVLVKDLGRMSEATIAGKGAPAVAAGETPPGGEELAAGGQDALPGGDVPESAGAAIPLVTLDRYRRRLREALSAMPVTESAGGALPAVYSQLAANFPPGAIKWVKSASWSGPKMIPLKDVDVADRDEWNASHEPGRIAKARKRLRKRTMAGDHPKPVVLVKTPGSGKWIIADGHHRFLAAEAEDQAGIWAFTGKVDREDGPWMVMAASQEEDEDARAA
jgi:HK97 family phage portal protein